MYFLRQMLYIVWEMFEHKKTFRVYIYIYFVMYGKSASKASCRPINKLYIYIYKYQTLSNVQHVRFKQCFHCCYAYLQNQFMGLNCQESAPLYSTLLWVNRIQATVRSRTVHQALCHAEVCYKLQYFDSKTKLYNKLNHH